MVESISHELFGSKAERQKLVDTDLGALADQLDRCTRQRGATGSARDRVNAVLRFVQHHIVTLAVLLALLLAAASIGG